MFCSTCGKEIDNNAVACPACGAATMRGSMPMPNSALTSNSTPNPTPVPGSVPIVPNHLVGAILATCCCCLPFGIVSIVFASSVNSKIAAGDIAGARAASNQAQTWMWLAFGVGIVWIFITVILPTLVSILPSLAVLAL